MKDRLEAMLIVNPMAHKLPSRKRLEEAERWLEERGWKVERRRTEAPGHATELASEAVRRRLPLVFVVGGDGTLNEVANGLAQSETALAAVWAGTVNIWARETGIPRRPVEAVRVQVEGERRRIDLGRCGERYFLLMAGYGLDGAIGRQVHPESKSRWGAVLYALAAARVALRYRSSRVKLRFNGEERAVNLLMLVAGNTRNYAGLVEIARDAQVDDGLLDVCAYEGRGTLDILLHGLRTLLRRHHRSSKVIYRKTQALEVSWERPLPVQLDGDAIADSPKRVEVAPGALWVAVPRGLSSPLFRCR